MSGSIARITEPFGAFFSAIYLGYISAGAPVSGSMARITEPFGAFFAVSSAAHIVPPPEIPVRRPSYG